MLVYRYLISFLTNSGAARLEQLLKEVNEDNLPQEWQTGEAVGREVW